MLSRSLRTTQLTARGALARAGPSCTACTRALSTASRPALLATTSRRAVSTPRVPLQRATYASPSNADVHPTGTHAMVGRELRTQIESELSTMRARIAALGAGAAPDQAWLHVLSDEETAFVNLGQVPGVDGAEVVTLLDLDLRDMPPELAAERQKAGKDGQGVHVPLLALAGTTEPAVPCYPLHELFGARGPKITALVRDVLAAQEARREDGAVQKADDLPLVAVVVPASGEQRDLGLPLALALFRLAIHEGNGHNEGVVDGGGQ